jgi:hypothetical protein
MNPAGARGISLRESDSRESRSNYVPGGYPNSVTRQEIWGSSTDELQQPGGGFPAPNYGPMSQQQPPPNQPRGSEYLGRGGGYQLMNTQQQMATQASSGGYRPEAYAPPGQPNYTTSYPQQAPIGQVSYSVDNSRIDAPRNMPSSAVYPPQGASQVPSGYTLGRGAGSYYAPPPSQPITTGYRTDTSGTYPDPYGGRPGAYIHRLSFPLSSPQVRSV